ncbi:MAG: NHLP leader peptide family RiPP precursor [Rubrobacter sp.]
MTEASSGREEMERRIVQRSLEDDAFRQQLLDDPKGTVEQELGTPLPEGVQIQAVEETADTVFLVLPHASRAGASGAQLSDSELEAVAGGGGWGSDESQCICSNFC